MKARASFIFLSLTALAFAAVLVWRNTATRRSAPTPAVQSASQPAPASSAKSGNVVAIEDGKTIDFSLGIPIVKDSEKEKAIIARVVREMEAAARGVTFESPTTPAPPAAAEKE